MKNRFADYLPATKKKDQPSLPALQELRNLAQDQFAYRIRQIESYVQVNPVTGVGAAFCIGIFLGWFINRR